MTKGDAIECLRKIKWHYQAGAVPGSYEYKRKQLEAIDLAIELIKKYHDEQ